MSEKNEFLITVNSGGASPKTLLTGAGKQAISIEWTAGPNVTGFTVSGLDGSFGQSNSGSSQVTSFQCDQRPDGTSHPYDLNIFSTDKVFVVARPRITNTSKP